MQEYNYNNSGQSLYLGDEVRVQLTGLVNHRLEELRGLQEDFVGIRFFLHKVQQRLHLLTSEVQGWIQVVNHTVCQHADKFIINARLQQENTNGFPRSNENTLTPRGIRNFNRSSGY